MRVPLAGGSLYRSVVPLASGEIGADLASYLLASEQTPAAVGVGVFVDTDGRVRGRGRLPGAGAARRDPTTRSTRSRRGSSAPPPPSELVRDGLGPVDMLQALVGGDLSVLEERQVRFRCRCSRERVAAAILAMGRTEIESVLRDGAAAPRSTCEFCGARYVVEESELRGLLSAASS